MPSSGLAVINLWMHTQNGVSTRNETNPPSTKPTLNANMEELHEFSTKKVKEEFTICSGNMKSWRA
jgi:hypothetical protein